MAYLKSTTIGGKLNVIGTLETRAVTMGSTTVTGIATSITNDATKLATAKAVYDYVQNNAGTMSSSVSGGTVTTTVTKGGWFAKNTTSKATVPASKTYSLSVSSISGSSVLSNGTVSGGYYPMTANNLSVTATASAGTAGWFSSTGAITDSDTDSVTVGKIAQSTVGNAVANTSDAAVLTLDPGKQTTISAGFYPSARIIRASIADTSSEAVNVGTASFAADDKTTTNVGVGTLSNGYYPITAGVSGTVTFSSAGWIAKTGASVQDTSVTVGRMAKATISNGFITAAGYIPDDNQSAYSTNYNSTDDCVDILFSN